MSTPQRPLDNRPSFAPTVSDFCAAPPSIRHFEVGQERQAIELLDHLVAEMVAKRVPNRCLAICGPVGAGKRVLARAIANEFGGDFLELEPHSMECLGSVQDMLDMLADLGDRVLLVHNVDELPDRARTVILAAIKARWLRNRRGMIAPRAHVPSTDAQMRPVSIPEFPVIATTNLCLAEVARPLEGFMFFTVDRSAAGSGAAISRTMRMHGVECTPEAARILGEFVVCAAGDLYPDLCVLAVAHARHQGLQVLDGAAATQVIRSAWAFMPPGVLLNSVTGAAKRSACDVSSAAGNLNVPPSLLASALALAPISPLLPFPGRQRQSAGEGDGDDNDDSDDGE